MSRRPLAAVVLIAFAARACVVAWAWNRFPAAADGIYYDAFARRLAEGAGYTWLWPDGVVTPAAHYPVGYPALLAPMYRVFGAHVGVAMAFNAFIGGIAVGALYLALRRSVAWGPAFIASAIVALHPALVPYTAAVMTEGVTLSLVVIAFAFARLPRRESVRWASVGMLMGLATLIRPQSLLLAPVLGWVSAGEGGRRKVLAAGVVSLLAIAVCLPWTIRNCSRMDRCALVSVNGGWNLLIGTQTQSGSWTELAVPDECKTVWSEAKKDSCFETVARREISREPSTWIRKVPKKVFTTFDYFGAAPWYLHQANGAAFTERAKIVLGSVETIVCRLMLLAALVVSARRAGPGVKWRVALAVLGACFACTEHGSIAYLALAVNLLLGEQSGWTLVTAAILLETMLIHGVFFGGGRYGLISVPFVTAIAFINGAKREDGMVEARGAFSESAPRDT